MKKSKIIEQIPRLYKYKTIKDQRGYFKKFFSEFQNNLVMKKEKIKEINYSINNKRGTLRGFHYQIGKYKEIKIIFCVKGKILDVSINMNKKSKNYKKIYKFILDEKKKYFLLIPKYHAHGFQTLKKNTNLLYLHSERYNKKFEKKINPLKNNLNIKWPLKISSISSSDKKNSKYE